jgi:membrane-associated phospholipid phosphatase
MRIPSKKPVVAAALLAAFFLWTPFQASASRQEGQSPPTVDRLNGAYVKQLGRDFVDVISSPAKWGTGDLLKFAAFIGTGALLYGFDKDIYDWVQRNKSRTSVDASAVISKFGNGGYLTAFMAALYAGGEIFDRPGLRRTALLSLESFLTTSALVLCLKAGVGRARPNAGESSRSFHPFSIKSGYASFPSGDAAGAFAVATTIAEESPDTVVDVLAYGLAGLVAVYRVHDRKHWPSDVLAGSALGFFVAKKISSLNRNGSSAAYQVSFQLTPSLQSVTLMVFF